MRKASILIATLGLTGLLFGACDDGDDGESGPNPRTAGVLMLTGDTVGGEMVFMTTCGAASCHGTTGDNGVAPPLSDQLPGRSDDFIVNTILNGVGDMPTQAHLEDQPVADVLAYLRENF